MNLSDILETYKSVARIELDPTRPYAMRFNAHAVRLGMKTVFDALDFEEAAAGALREVREDEPGPKQDFELEDDPQIEPQPGRFRSGLQFYRYILTGKGKSE